MRGVRQYASQLEVQQAQKTIKAGFMVKKGQGEEGQTLIDVVTRRKGDKVRWVVLKGNGEMIYYKDERSKHPQVRWPCMAVRIAALPAATRILVVYIAANRGQATSLPALVQTQPNLLQLCKCSR